MCPEAQSYVSAQLQDFFTVMFPDTIIVCPSPFSFPPPSLPTVMPPRIFLLLFLLFLLSFFNTSSFCVTQISLEIRILLSQPTECWDYVCVTLTLRFYLWNDRTFHLEFWVELATLPPRRQFGCGRRLSPPATPSCLHHHIGRARLCV